MHSLRPVRAALALLPLIVLSSVSGFSQTATVRRSSNLRKSASTSSAIIEVLSAGTEVTLISNKLRSGYYYVQAADGATGWALAKNVSVSPSTGNPVPQPTSGSLIAQLQAARVAAVPQSLVIGGHEVCAAAGDSDNEGQTLVEFVSRLVPSPLDQHALTDREITFSVGSEPLRPTLVESVSVWI